MLASLGHSVSASLESAGARKLHFGITLYLSPGPRKSVSDGIVLSCFEVSRIPPCCENRGDGISGLYSGRHDHLAIVRTAVAAPSCADLVHPGRCHPVV